MNYYLNKLMTYHEVHRMARDGFSVSKKADNKRINPTLLIYALY